MKRILLATAGVAVVAVFAATIGFAQPTAATGPTTAPRRHRRRCRSCRRTSPRGSGSSSASSATRRRSATSTSAARTPASTSRSRSGSPATPSAVSSASRSSALRLPVREPLLTGGRVDLVISTFTYTADRDTRIDFSRAYYKATGRLLVKNDSPIQSLNDIRGPQGRDDAGLDLRPLDEALLLERRGARASRASPHALLAFNQGRADAVMFDDTSLALQAATDPNAKLTDDLFLEAAVRDRDQAGQRRAEALGRLAARAHEAEGHLPGDHQEQRRAAVRAGVLAGTSCGRTTLHVPAGDAAQRRHCLSVVTRSTTTGEWPPRAATPLVTHDRSPSPTTSGRSSPRTGRSCSTACSTRSRCRRSRLWARS